MCTPKRAVKHMKNLLVTNKTYTGIDFVFPSCTNGDGTSSDKCWFLNEDVLSESSARLASFCTMSKTKVKKKKKSIIPGNNQ